MRKPLTPDQLIAILVNRVNECGAIHRIAVPVELPRSTIGARPTVQLVDLSLGFDWDKGTLFLHPEQPLTPLTSAELEEIKRCRAEGQSWVMYKALERWTHERDDLLDVINRLRQALMLTGMSTSELDLLTGELPRKCARARKKQGENAE